MAGVDLKARLKNKTFWVAMISAVVLLLQQLGLNIIPSNYADIVNTVLSILTMLGIVVDTSTPGLSDKTSTIVVDASSTENNTAK